MSQNTISVVDKELIDVLHFPKEDVLFSKGDRDERITNLKKALVLGNAEHLKVKIIFQDIEGAKMVETTLWGLTDQELILKQGRTIPIHRVTEITLI